MILLSFAVRELIDKFWNIREWVKKIKFAVESIIQTKLIENF